MFINKYNNNQIIELYNCKHKPRDINSNYIFLIIIIIESNFKWFNVLLH